MDLQHFVASLDRGMRSLSVALSGVEADESRWRPSPERWSLVEIACHLLDEECLDFRARVASTLDDPTRAWPPIDPERWARERGYRERDLSETLAALRGERLTSLDWLRGLETADWTRAYDHPQLGALRAGDLLAAWAAHDLLHLAQIARTRAAWLSAAAAPFSTRYAMP
jgi:hypothetical protein